MLSAQGCTRAYRWMSQRGRLVRRMGTQYRKVGQLGALLPQLLLQEAADRWCLLTAPTATLTRAKWSA